MSAAETDTLRDVRRCPRKRRICSLRILNPCPRLSADDETLRICEKTLVRDVRRSKMSDFLFVRGLSRTFVDLWLFCFRLSCLWICLLVVALTCDRCSFALAQPRPRCSSPSEMAGADAPASAADCLCRLCGHKFRLDQGRSRSAQTFECHQCLAIDKQLRRNLGEYADELRGQTPEDQRRLRDLIGYHHPNA